MKKHIIMPLITAATLSGCVSSSDFASMQSQVRTLNQKIGQLERDLDQTQTTLDAVKGQRMVRLPTGAPTTTEARRNNPPTYVVSAQDRAFESAVSQYKSGDLQAAMQTFSQFNQRYPNAKQHNEALFYLGQAGYTARDYPRARQALETLVYQSPNGRTNSKAIDLLKRVYHGEGNAAGNTRLADFLRSPSIIAPSTSIAPTSQVVEQPQTPNSGSIFEAPAEPLRPSTLDTF